MNHAFSLLHVKSVKEDERVISGIASTPTPDRMGDVVEPLGAEFSLPMPLLWQHNHDQPVGHVEFAKPTADGIPFRARVFSSDAPGETKNLLDKAWQNVKLGLVRAVSIGFTIKEYAILKTGGYRIESWEWLELSLVTIPAQAEAVITGIKGFDSKAIDACGWKAKGERLLAKDARQLAASGRSAEHESTSAGVTASKSSVVKPKEGKRIMAKKTIAEQIAGYQVIRTKKLDEMNDIMTAAADADVSLDATQKDAYDELEREVADLDDHIKRLERHDALNRKSATVVDGATAEGASDSRSGEKRGALRVDATVHTLPKKLEPGIKFTRYVMALARARGDKMLANHMVKENAQWMAETPDLADMILKTAVNAGNTTDTTFASPLVNYQVMTQEFIDYLRPRTIIGRIPNLRKVPFNVKVPSQTGGATVNWVGEGKVKPLTSAAFSSVSLTYSKIAGIIILTDELVRLSNPSAETLIREDLANSIVQFMDSQFLDITKAADDVSPASVTNGLTPDNPTGTTAAALRLDLGNLLKGMYANNVASGLVWIMTQQQALSISLMQNSLGQAQFQGINPEGGTLLGYPVITSENIPAAGGSPTDGYPIIIMRPQDILLADDGNVTIDASREASLQMDTAPDSPPTASTVTVSMFQQNMVAIRAERWINWKKARSTAVDLIQGGRYAE